MFSTYMEITNFSTHCFVWIHREWKSHAPSPALQAWQAPDNKYHNSTTSDAITCTCTIRNSVKRMLMCKTCSFDVAIRNSYNMGRNAIFDLCWPSPRAHNTLGRGWYKLNMTQLPMFSTNLCWYCVGDLLTVASDLEFLGRQADHSRSVPIVILHYRQDSGYSQVLSQAIMNRWRQFILHICMWTLCYNYF